MNIEIDLNKWIYFLDNNEKAHLFHTKEIHDVFLNTKGIKPILITSVKEKELSGLALGEVSSVLFPFFGITKRTTFYAEPLFSDDLQILDNLLKEIIIKSSGLLIEIRPHYKLTKDELQVYFQNGFIFNDHLNAILPLFNIDELWQNLADDKKKGILIAQKHPIKISEINTLYGVNLFYELAESLYKRKKRIFKPKEYFINLLRNDKFHFLFAFYNDIPIATQLYYNYRNTITAYYTATHSDYNKKHAGDLLKWELIKRGIDLNYNYLDFGGGGKPDRPYGVREYKKRFNVNFENIGRLIYSPKLVRPIVNRIYRGY